MMRVRRRSSRLGCAPALFGAARVSCPSRSSRVAAINSRSIACLRQSRSILGPLDTAVAANGPDVEISQLQAIRLVNRSVIPALDHVNLQFVARGAGTVHDPGLDPRKPGPNVKQLLSSFDQSDVSDTYTGVDLHELVRFNELLIRALFRHAHAQRAR